MMDNEKLEKLNVVVTQLEASVKSVAGDVSDIKTTMRDVSVALVQLARLEERHINLDRSITLIFEKLNRYEASQKVFETKMDERVKKLEEKAPINNLTSTWVIGLASGGAGIVLTFVLTMLLTK